MELHVCILPLLQGMMEVAVKNISQKLRINTIHAISQNSKKKKVINEGPVSESEIENFWQVPNFYSSHKNQKDFLPVKGLKSRKYSL